VLSMLLTVACENMARRASDSWLMPTRLVRIRHGTYEVRALVARRSIKRERSKRCGTEPWSYSRYTTFWP